MLSPDEQKIVIEGVKARTERTATSRLAAPKAKSLTVVKKGEAACQTKGDDF